MRPAQPDSGTSERKDAVRRCLESRGASFLIDIVAQTGLDSRVVQRILWEMIWSGEVTHDYFKLLRSGKPPVVREPKSPPALRYPTDRRRFYRDRTRIAKTFGKWGLSQAPAGGLSPFSGPGRWTLLSPLAPHEADEQESLEIYARILLERYGVVAKDLVQRTGEPGVVWGDLYEVYQRMELSGEIERGYFVDGLAGAQFGLPEAVDDLMDRSRMGSMRREPDRHPILVNACDPAYLYSSAGPFDVGFGRVTRLPSNYAVLIDGHPALTIELGSGTLAVRDDLSPDDAAIAIPTLKHLLDAPWPVRPYRRIELTSLGSGPIAGSPVEDLLTTIGFEHQGSRMVLWSADRRA